MRRTNTERPVVAAVIVIACGILISWPVGAAADNESREVTLTAVADGSGGCTITVSPETAIISRGKKAKIKKVYWVGETNPELGDLYWEIRYEPGKGGNSQQVRQHHKKLVRNNCSKGLHPQL